MYIQVISVGLVKMNGLRVYFYMRLLNRFLRRREERKEEVEGRWICVCSSHQGRCPDTPAWYGGNVCLVDRVLQLHHLICLGMDGICLPLSSHLSVCLSIHFESIYLSSICLSRFNLSISLSLISLSL
ncbi:hypothetical protein CSUI_010759 [Cystoisospora suis]|uniref:Uncharacterized protein n=1 Tax=Cystoisospora suis TaxID=483139 RepID=A0A2C6KE66_9APIC|nr:hypothetical protein CSUI_010759 [Cystoisospora suis]